MKIDLDSNEVDLDFNSGHSLVGVRYEEHATDITVGEVRLIAGFNDVHLYIAGKRVWHGTVSDAR